MESGLRGVNPASVFRRPTADEIWLGPTQVSALSLLSGSARLAGVAGRRASGRSLLLQRVQRDLIAAGALTLNLDGRATDPRRVLTTLLAATGLNGSHLSPIDQRNLLHLVVAERLREGRRVVLFVDDAESLVAPVLEELDRLSHFGDGGNRELAIRFAYNPAATSQSRMPDPLAAGERATVGYLDDVQLEAYMHWRLDRHRLPVLFTRTALLLTRRYTGGVFRAVDSLSRLALLLMQRRRAARVDVQCVNQAAHMLMQQRAVSRNQPAEAPGIATGVPSSRHADVPAGRFIVTDHGAPVMRIPLARRLMIGRAPTNEISISGVEISRYHAMVEAAEGRIEIIDLNSANGIRVNGERRRQAVLEDRDIVTIGAYKLKLETRASNTVAPNRHGGAELPDTVVFPPVDRIPGSHLKSV